MFLKSFVPSGKPVSLGSELLNSLFNLITFWQSLRLEKFTRIDSILSSIMSTPMCCRTLHIVGFSSLWSTEAGTLKISTNSLQEYWVVLHTSRSAENTCFDKALFNIFNKGNIRLHSLISSASKFIVFSVFS